MKRCSTSLIIREMQIKPQWGPISCQSEWLWSKSLQAINAGEGVEIFDIWQNQSNIVKIKNKIILNLKKKKKVHLCAKVPLNQITELGSKTMCVLSHFSCVWLFMTLWTLPGFSVSGLLQTKYWSGLPCPPPGDHPDPGI